MSQDILKRFNIRAKKGLGQNFLQDDFILNEICSTLEVQGKNIVEVGPGYGALTKKLIDKQPKNIDLVELDSDMIHVLNKRIEQKDFAGEKTNIHIHHIDVLEYIPVFDEYYVIANIPYYITSPILRHFLYDIKNKPEYMIILMQDDVGQKILGKGKNKSSVLSLFIEKKCYVSEIIKVPKECFIPAPKIESSVLLFESHEEYSEVSDELFLEIIKKGFCEPRKKLSKNLIKSGYEKEKILNIFEKLGHDQNLRGEDLDIEQWIILTKNLIQKNH